MVGEYQKLTSRSKVDLFRLPLVSVCSETAYPTREPKRCPVEASQRTHFGGKKPYDDWQDGWIHTKKRWNRCGLVYLLWQPRSLICDRGVEAEERMGRRGGGAGEEEGEEEE